jgi:uncharacterized membrane protein YeaQ/YmgE (transglycosylase-associated protein family)
MTNFIAWIVVGGLIGLVGSMRSGGRHSLGASMAAGIIGAVLAGMILTPLFGVSLNAGGFSLAAVMIAAIGGTILSAVITLFGRASVYTPPPPTVTQPVSSAPATQSSTHAPTYDDIDLNSPEARAADAEAYWQGRADREWEQQQDREREERAERDQQDAEDEADRKYDEKMKKMYGDDWDQ